MGIWSQTLISSDLDFDGAFKEKLEEDEKRLRPLFYRPAYKGTMLEDKINGSFKEYLQNREEESEDV